MSISAQRNVKRPDLAGFPKAVGRPRKHADDRARWRAWKVENRKSAERPLPKLKPATPEQLSRAFVESAHQRQSFKDAGIRGSDELLRLLRLHHPEHERRHG